MKISELYSLENISDMYEVRDDFEVYNIKTGLKKKATKNKRDGYMYYTLSTKDKKVKKVYKHKIIALAFIENKPYELINHIDGNKENNLPSNLEFSDHKGNYYHAKEHGLIPEKECAIYTLELFCGDVLEGTMEELHKKTKIPLMTLYDNTYQKRKSRKIKHIYKKSN